MLTKKDRKIKNQEVMIHNRDILIGDMEEQTKVLYEEKKNLAIQNENKTNLINDIIKELYSNLKNDEQKVSKIKELVRDYQSIN